MSDSAPPTRREDSGDVIARLLRLAGPRERAPLVRAERVREAVRGQWRRGPESAGRGNLGIQAPREAGRLDCNNT